MLRTEGLTMEALLDYIRESLDVEAQMVEAINSGDDAAILALARKTYGLPAQTDDRVARFE